MDRINWVLLAWVCFLFGCSAGRDGSGETRNFKNSKKSSEILKLQVGSGYEYLQALTGSDEHGDAKRFWDSAYSQEGYLFGTEPAPYLQKFVSHFPKGRALDLAMGEGRNAVFLARNGFQVDGVDISEVALQKARRLAAKNQVSFQGVLADLTTYQIEPQSYDLIVCFHFLLRDMIPKMVAGLKPGGYIIFENYTVDQLRLKPKSVIPREWLLEKGEALKLFSGLTVLDHESLIEGDSALERIIVRKPPIDGSP